MARALAVAALAISIVTAAVTMGRSQPAGEFQAVITNLATGSKHSYRAKTWPGQFQCDAAIKGLNEVLQALNAGVQPVEPVDADPQVRYAVENIVVAIFQNTGKLPRLSLSCELKADPA